MMSDSDSKESACNAGDLSSIPGLGRSPGEGKGYSLQYSCLKNPYRQRSLVGYSPQHRKESGTTEVTQHTHTHIIGWFVRWMLVLFTNTQVIEKRSCFPVHDFCCTYRRMKQPGIPSSVTSSLSAAINNAKTGTSLVAQWLRCHTPTVGGAGLILGQGTRIPHAAWL